MQKPQDKKAQETYIETSDSELEEELNNQMKESDITKDFDFEQEEDDSQKK